MTGRLTATLMAAIVGGLASVASAQIGETTPAEFPPASFKGKQYVDSNGCVFIRAGIDGNVTWVPRVSRDRQLICGFRPSLAGQVAEAEPEAAPAPSPPPVIGTPTQTAPVVTAAETAPEVTAPKSPPPRVTQTAAAPAPAPRPVRRAQPVVVRQTAPAPKPRVVVQAPKQVTRQQIAVPGTACPNASPLGQQYLRGSGVRCGPQGQRVVAVDVVSNARTVGAVSSSAPQVTATTRIAPKHVVENRFNTRNVQVPHGYRPVWDDDRLNPYRAEQNLAGRSDMLLVWTQTVPRRLIDRRTGRDVTAKVPLVYPYTSVPQQEAELGQVQLVTQDGQLMKRIVRRPGARAPVYSSRSAPKPAPRVEPAAQSVRLPAASRVVQVGVYANPANAQRAATKISQLGLSARIGKSQRGGRTLYSVQAGPFGDATRTGRALMRLRQAGYSDAYAK